MDKKTEIILYGHSFCGTVPPIRKVLRAAQAPYRYIDITLSPEGREHVSRINAGNLSVPTLVFPDGSTLTEPSMPQLQSRLEANGYPVSTRQIQRATRNNLFQSTSFWILLMFIMYAILRGLGVI